MENESLILDKPKSPQILDCQKGSLLQSTALKDPGILVQAPGMVWCTGFLSKACCHD